MAESKEHDPQSDKSWFKSWLSNFPTIGPKVGYFKYLVSYGVIIHGKARYLSGFRAPM